MGMSGQEAREPEGGAEQIQSEKVALEQIDREIMSEEFEKACKGLVKQGCPRRIHLKVKDQQGNESQFSLKKSTPLRKVIDSYCSQAGLQSSQLQFTVNGLPVEPNDTADALGLSDDDSIDVDEAQCHASQEHDSSTADADFLAMKERAHLLLERVPHDVNGPPALHHWKRNVRIYPYPITSDSINDPDLTKRLLAYADAITAWAATEEARTGDRRGYYKIEERELKALEEFSLLRPLLVASS